MSKIVVALGGNALGNTNSQQKENVEIAAKAIVELVKQHHKVIVGHGNGPQVGMINSAFVDAGVDMPFAECGAMSQGYIGYHLQNAILRQLGLNNIDKKVLTVISQVEVSRDDEAFLDPTKPIGPFMSKAEADELKNRHSDYIIRQINSNGYRRVVASPIPIDIIEKDAIKDLIERDYIVISCGGGGIPVVKNDAGDYKGIAAVIDKDYACEKLAELIDADKFVILTDVDKVCLNYDTPACKSLDTMTTSECDKYIDDGEFGKGSMLPKIIAAKTFVEKTNNEAIITSISKVSEATNYRSGTIIKGR